MPIQLNWISRDTRGDLLRLYDVSLGTVTASGTYVIYAYDRNVPRTIYVGQGAVADRLAVHRTNLTIRSIVARTPVYVAFAAVNALNRDGVERYLADRLQPMLGDAHPTATAVPVNLPFAA